MNQQALQDLVDWECYGCGRLNASGLQIKSYWSDDELVCDWEPQAFHVGHPGKLHHGVTATLCFCHGAWAATSAAHRQEGREMQNPVEFFYINQSLWYESLNPISIESTVTFRARVTALEGGEAAVETGAYVGDLQCVKAQTRLVRVSAEEFVL